MKPILPMPPSGCRPEQSIFASQDGRISGLTKREYIAAGVLAAVVGNSERLTVESAALLAVAATDALIAALNARKGDTN